MPNYRRVRLPGATYFFTLVTHKRRHLLIDDIARGCLRAAISKVRAAYPFEINAFCLLPDHLHTIWRLPEDDNDYSLRWRAIKGEFSRCLRRQGGANPSIKPSASRHIRGETAIWQRRFWEHLIRDEKDFKRHLDYIHFNPVKHGLVDSVIDWPWSSFHRYVREGVYPADWGGSPPTRMNLKTVGE